MSKNNKSIDTSTVCDLLLKNWLDAYPQDKISALMAKANSISFTINSTNDEYLKLYHAKEKLDELYSPIQEAIASLSTGLSKRQKFISEFGDLGVSLATPPEEIAHTIHLFSDTLTDYAKNVTERYFANLANVEKTLGGLKSIRDFYSTLATLITTIRDAYFKTAPDRRKPLVREIYRMFKSLSENNLIFGIAPSIPNSLIKNPIDEEEFKSIEKVWREAKKAAQTMKDAR